MLGNRLPKHRKFDYEPLYYDKEKDEREGKRIKFTRSTNLRRQQAKQRSLIWLITLFGMVAYLIYYFAKIGK